MILLVKILWYKIANFWSKFRKMCDDVENRQWATRSPHALGQDLHNKEEEEEKEEEEQDLTESTGVVPAKYPPKMLS